MPKASTTQTFAPGQITSSDLNAIISGFQLEDGSVDGVSILIAAGVLSIGILQASNLGANSVTASAILDGVITAAKLATDSVETAKVKDGAITNPKVADSTLEFVKLAAAALATQANMQSETASKLAAAATMKWHPGVAKAYGTVTWEGSLVNVTGGYNVTSAAEVTPGTREITLAVTMANTNYIVLCTGNGGGSQFNVTSKTTTKFTIDGPAEAPGRTVSFLVLGQLA